MSTKFYSDRVTEIFMSGDRADSVVVHEVTVEDERRDEESVDFSTIAWCPSQEGADRIRRALRVLEEVEEWLEGDERERTLAQLVSDLFLNPDSTQKRAETRG